MPSRSKSNARSKSNSGPPPRRVSKGKLLLIVLLVTGLGSYALFSVLFYANQDRFVYPRPHNVPPTELSVWTEANEIFGFARLATDPVKPRAVWLVLQGNGSSAGMRDYFNTVPATEAIYVLEYPGYGSRPGTPNEDTINAAAAEAYDALRQRFRGVPLGVVGESFGSGPACALASRQPAPDSITLIVPIANFRQDVGRLLPHSFARYLLRDNWDNRANLRSYTAGPITIYGAVEDEVIPREVTESLAAANPRAQIHWLPGGHVGQGEPRPIRLGGH